MINEKAKRTWVILRVIEGLILIALGVLAIVYSDNDTFKNIIFYVIGGVLCFDGIIRVIRYYIEPVTAASVGEGLISSIFEISVGLVFIVKASAIVDMFNQVLVFFAVILMFCAAATLITGSTVALIKRERKLWIAVIEFVVAACLIAGGVTILVKNSDAEKVMLRIAIILAGIFILAVGCVAIVTAFVPFARLKPKKPIVEEVGRKEKKAKEDKEKREAEEKAEEEAKTQDVEAKPNPNAGTNMEEVHEEPADKPAD